MSLTRKQFLGTLAGAAAAVAAPGLARAQSPITLRFQQFLPPQAQIPSKAIAPWAEKVQAESGGRLRVQLFPAMQLGGKPPELFDQAKDGVVDLIWTVLGYTPGRFPKSELFELPFFCGGGESGSQAFHAYVEKNAMDEFRDVKLIAAHIHGPGLFHSREPINKLEDVRGMRIRGGSRITNIMLEQLGAVPVGMPVPQVGEALSRGVITATTIPWEVVPALRVHQIVRNHTGFSGDKGLYTQTFCVAMNRASYDRLPADLKKVIDDNSGMAVARTFGRIMDEGDKIGIDLARQARNSIVTLDAAETLRWRRTAGTVRDVWLKEVGGRGINGAALLADAEALIAKYRT
jgi:TRAP-type C4-dicarboxylate transport system substrate-binding protein